MFFFFKYFMAKLEDYFGEKNIRVSSTEIKIKCNAEQWEAGEMGN